MFTETEGIVLRQTKIAGGRRMILVFTKKFGKISCGTSLNERGKGRQALAIRPFSYANYQLFKRGEYININGAETLKSFYHIGEDVDKYMYASYGLEIADKLTEEGEPHPALFNLTVDFLSEMEVRGRSFATLLAGYLTRAISLVGLMPRLEMCARCGMQNEPAVFDIREGGMICKDCVHASRQIDNASNDTLIYNIDFGIIGVLKFFLANQLGALRKLALPDDTAGKVIGMMTEHARYHLDFGELKSETFVNGTVITVEKEEK